MILGFTQNVQIVANLWKKNAIPMQIRAAMKTGEINPFVSIPDLPEIQVWLAEDRLSTSFSVYPFMY